MGTLLFYNEPAEAILGRRFADVKPGRRINELLRYLPVRYRDAIHLPFVPSVRAQAIDSLAGVARRGRTIDQDKMNYALAFVKGLHPADQLEATLGVQMAAIHLATMKAAENLSSRLTRG